jgi:RNA-binding protein YhbY
MDYNEDFKKVLLAEPHALLGKKGITEEFINHVINLLKKYKIVKIKALKSIANKENIRDIANQIANSTSSHLLDVRGKIFIISKIPIKRKI